VNTVFQWRIVLAILWKFPQQEAILLRYLTHYVDIRVILTMYWMSALMILVIVTLVQLAQYQCLILMGVRLTILEVQCISAGVQVD